jgi:hypothetical protein
MPECNMPRPPRIEIPGAGVPTGIVLLLTVGVALVLVGTAFLFLR